MPVSSFYPMGLQCFLMQEISIKKKFEKKHNPLKATSPKPNNSLSAAQWIAYYIKNTMPKDKKPILNYGLLSHFHEDHYGSFVALANEIPIKKIIDRNYPDYNFPLDLKTFLAKDLIFSEYISFIEKNKIPSESLIVGSDSQIKLVNSLEKYPTFKIRNVKSNGTIWTGKNNDTLPYFTAADMTTFYKGKYNENPLSLALKFRMAISIILQAVIIPVYKILECPLGLM